jgi:hypothetical protein
MHGLVLTVPCILPLQPVNKPSLELIRMRQRAVARILDLVGANKSLLNKPADSSRRLAQCFVSIQIPMSSLRACSTLVACRDSTRRSHNLFSLLRRLKERPHGLPIPPLPLPLALLCATIGCGPSSSSATALVSCKLSDAVDDPCTHSITLNNGMNLSGD